MTTSDPVGEHPMTTEGLDALRERLAQKLCDEIVTRRGTLPRGAVAYREVADAVIPLIWSAACQQQRAEDVEALQRELERGNAWFLTSLPLADTPAAHDHVSEHTFQQPRSK